MDEYEKTNLAHWDELVGVHLGLGSDYDVAGFKAGRSTLKLAERRELGDVAGKSLLNLLWHFGLYTPSWATLGVSVGRSADVRGRRLIRRPTGAGDQPVHVQLSVHHRRCGVLADRRRPPDRTSPRVRRLLFPGVSVPRAA